MTPSNFEAFLQAQSTIWDGTWKEWLNDILLTFFSEGECFSGKRPNCDSGWDYEVMDALAEHVDPKIAKSRHEDGTIKDYDTKRAYTAFKGVVDYVFYWKAQNDANL